MKKFTNYIKESIELDKNSLYKETKEEFIEKIKETLTNDLTTEEYKKFLSDYMNEKTAIGTLSIDSDVYEFYLKHMNNLDRILINDQYFDNKPEVFSLYEYTIVGTKKALKLLAGLLIEEIV